MTSVFIVSPPVCQNTIRVICKLSKNCLQQLIIFKLSWSVNLVNTLFWFKKLICHSESLIALYEPPHNKTNKMTCEPSDDLDKPGHPPSLISVFAVCFMGSLGPKLCAGGQQRVWTDWADSQADLNLLWRMVILLLLSYGGSYQMHPVPEFLERYALHFIQDLGGEGGGISDLS